MSNKTIMGITLAAATIAFAVAPVASFAKKVECYGAKGAKEGVAKMMTAKNCKKAGGTTTKPAAPAEAAPAEAAPAAPADAAPATTETPAS